MHYRVAIVGDVCILQKGLHAAVYKGQTLTLRLKSLPLAREREANEIKVRFIYSHSRAA